MMKYQPKNRCTCGKTQWDFDENISSFKCRFCKKVIEKKLHTLDGAILNKNDEGRYVLAFPEYKEISYYSAWDSLQKAMNKIGGKK